MTSTRTRRSADLFTTAIAPVPLAASVALSSLVSFRHGITTFTSWGQDTATAALLALTPELLVAAVVLTRRTGWYPRLVLVTAVIGMAVLNIGATPWRPGPLLGALWAPVVTLLVLPLTHRNTPPPPPTPRPEPAPDPPVAPPAQDTTTSTAAPTARPVPLPGPLRATLDQAHQNAADTGRVLTPADIAELLRVPEPLAQRLAAELHHLPSAPLNGTHH